MISEDWFGSLPGGSTHEMREVQRWRMAKIVVGLRPGVYIRKTVRLAKGSWKISLEGIEVWRVTRRSIGAPEKIDKESKDEVQAGDRRRDSRDVKGPEGEANSADLNSRRGTKTPKLKSFQQPA